jgi:hypothetical protein
MMLMVIDTAQPECKVIQLVHRLKSSARSKGVGGEDDVIVMVNEADDL